MIAIQRATRLDLGLLIMTMMIWGMAFVAMKVAVPETGPYWLAAMRAGLGLCAVAPFLLYFGFEWPKNLRQWGFILILVIFNTTIPLILISWAQLSLTAGISALLMGTGPFIALFAGHFVTSDERFTLIRLLAVLMGFAGVLSVVGLDALADFSFDHLLAEGALILASAMYVVAGFTIRRIALPSLSLASLSLAIGTIFLVPLSLAMSGPFPGAISDKALIWLVFVGLFGTGLGFILRFYLINRIGYSMFSIGVNLIPVFGVIFGALILGEAITIRIALALFLIVGGLFVARLGGKKS